MATWSLDIEQDFVLLLAATIQPNRSMLGKIAVADPRAREKAYVEGLSYYLQNHPRIRKFVFVENSGWPLESFQQAIDPFRNGKEIEFLSLECNTHPDGLPFSISYGESTLMQQGIDQSKLIGNTRYLGKITGRLKLLNMTKLLQAAPRPFEFYCDLQSHHVPIQIVNTSKSWLAVRWKPRHYYQCDTRFFVTTLPFYKTHLRDLHDRPLPQGDAYWIEGAWFETIFPMIHDPTVVARFPIQPHYSGMNATIGFSYDSRKETLKRTFRGLMRKVVPSWWL